MKITPMDISHKEFTQAFRGYNPQEVRGFLNEIGTELEHLFTERTQFLCEIDSLKKTIERYHGMEESLQNTLLLAQKTSSDTIANAKREGELIVQEARNKATSVSEEHARARALRNEFIIELNALLSSFQERLQQLAENERETAQAARQNES